MEYYCMITGNYLCLPVKTAEKEQQKLATLSITLNGEKQFEFRIPEFHSQFDYYALLNVEAYKGKELRLEGELPPSYFESMIQKDIYEREDVLRPFIHFTADYGWINDPNGLVYHDGFFHLCFQYNPFNIEWENMSWGSAVSRDLLHWEQADTVLWPDENGTVFSGSAIVNQQGLLGLNRDALIYFYTAAGRTSVWSEQAGFTQRLAYSTDGGKTLIKWPEPILHEQAYESRDPKVFWHEETEAYVMALWIEKNDFALFRSTDLLSWERTQTLTLPEAWECPDLFCLCAEDGSRKWVFWSADGYYFTGEFDGRHFQPDGERRLAYGTKLPYAAQTFSGTAGRVITLPWLRTLNKGKPYRGMMGLPRELSLTGQADGYRLKLKPTAEYEACRNTVYEKKGIRELDLALTGEDPFDVQVTWETEEPGTVSIAFLQKVLLVETGKGIFSLPGQRYEAGEPIRELSVLVDKGIVEITANDGIIYLTYEIEQYWLNGIISIRGTEKISVSVGQIGSMNENREN